MLHARSQPDTAYISRYAATDSFHIYGQLPNMETYKFGSSKTCAHVIDVWVHCPMPYAHQLPHLDWIVTGCLIWQLCCLACLTHVLLALYTSYALRYEAGGVSAARETQYIYKQSANGV